MTLITATPPRSHSVSDTTIRRPPSNMRGPVLIAVDDDPGAATLAAAKAMAHQLDVPVQAIAALEPPPLLPGSDGVSLIPTGYDGYREADLDGMVRRRLLKEWGSKVNWQLDVVVGAPARVIADEARRRNASMIVMGKGRHSTVDKLFGGEITLKVAMRATVPVLAVAPEFDRAPANAVVGVDFSVTSFCAARAALAILGCGLRERCTLSVVHIRPAAPLGMNDWASRYDEAIAPRLANFAQQLEPYAGSDVRITTHILDGPAVETLLNTVADTDGDLVAVGTTGHNWWQRLFIGSTATAVLRQSRRSVLIAPQPSALERVRLEMILDGRSSLDAPEDWDKALQAFTTRNRGRKARLEIVDPPLGLPTLAVDGYQFSGASYDSGTGVTLMFENSAILTQHVSHRSSNVVGVELVADSVGHDRALLLEGMRGHAVLTFMD